MSHDVGPQGETGEPGPAGPQGVPGRAGDPSPDLGRLIATIDSLRADIAGHKAELLVADRRSRWARTAALVGILVGIVGIAVGTGGAIFGVNAQTSADDIARERNDARISGCVQANVTTQRTREALVAGVSVLDVPNPQRTADQQAALDRFIATYTAHVEAALPMRDCSAGGVDAYFARPPADPATTSTTTRKG